MEEIRNCFSWFPGFLIKILSPSPFVSISEIRVSCLSFWFGALAPFALITVISVIRVSTFFDHPFSFASLRVRLLRPSSLDPRPSTLDPFSADSCLLFSRCQLPTANCQLSHFSISVCQRFSFLFQAANSPLPSPPPFSLPPHVPPWRPDRHRLQRKGQHLLILFLGIVLELELPRHARPLLHHRPPLPIALVE